MIKLKDPVSIVLLIINIIFLLYYSIQLLIFTDEFALKNIGFYNHAVAGLSEIIGINGDTPVIPIVNIESGWLL